MKAVIMAGGEGSRLRPMTCACPKPMVPVMDKPVMAYALELLKRHGVTEAAVTLMYLPGRVTDYFGDGSDYGLRLTYYTEETPLGTAGSVKQAEKMLDETFVVLSGDGLTDCDLKSALAFHKEKKALATMVLKKVATPLEYGVVLTDSAGRVERFVEKPGWGEVCSDAVNTGIYLFEPEVLQYIPDNKPCDFGRELFPKLVEAGLPVYGYLMDGYWCDIGDTSAYLRANADMLDGKMALARDLRPGGVNRMAGA
ncbi:MAG: nucleotidyltransferase family protein, partial [Clostridia bacterium]